VAGLLALAGCPDRIAATSPGTGSGTGTGTGTGTLAAACAPWARVARCQQAGRVFAVGRALGLGSVGLQRAALASRARAALLGSATGSRELHGSEVPLFARCGTEGLALASAPASELPDAAALPPCPAAVSATPQPPAGCPPWSGRISWREGDTIFAVAAVDGVRNPALVARVGEGRAREEAADPRQRRWREQRLQRARGPAAASSCAGRDRDLRRGHLPEGRRRGALRRWWWRSDPSRAARPRARRSSGRAGRPRAR